MSKTNCINCGASKEVSDQQCPFCGTTYADLTTIELFSDKPIFIQLRGKDGNVKTAKAYITNTTIRMEPDSSYRRDMHGRLRYMSSMNVRGSIDFTLYESLE